ncbi:hypothetical protein [Streptomyces sp. Isolate_219]|uniref:hypothetical protein n=1 Tax=Streptomyces sp. Isolate_219 TaxID=2950110 RepID=UPI0021C7C45C|nr:hypothetical protein [Streptomyces sp. Isolate_219]MCR8576152.1 hypothetical protein [Streptomyces sp. Isolate_219]
MSDAARHTVRIIVHTLLGLAAALPLIITAADIPRTATGVGVALAVAAGLTRVTALPAVQKLLPKWLRTTPPDIPSSGGEQPSTPPAANDGGSM